jgi:hypothetical protein
MRHVSLFAAILLVSAIGCGGQSNDTLGSVEVHVTAQSGMGCSVVDTTVQQDGIDLGATCQDGAWTALLDPDGSSTVAVTVRSHDGYTYAGTPAVFTVDLGGPNSLDVYVSYTAPDTH